MKARDIVDISVLEGNTEMAIPILARKLREGTLALALGAGASAKLGLPRWWQLVSKSLNKAGISDSVDEKTSNETLRAKMEKVEQATTHKYFEIVHEALYEGVNYYSKNVLHQDLLIALGALLMGSNRGSIKEVFNFNFDDVLDWYLQLHGFSTQTITGLPSLRATSDVAIYHPHGYLPKSGPQTKFSKFLIFSQHSYDERFANFATDPWIAEFKHLLKTKEVLFVGLSGDDPIFGPLLLDTKVSTDRERYTGFWFFGPKTDDDRVAAVKARNVVPLRFNDYDEIPEYLLKVCQAASTLPYAPRL